MQLAQDRRQLRVPSCCSVTVGVGDLLSAKPDAARLGRCQCFLGFTAEPVELGDGNFTPDLLGRPQRGLQLRPPVERIAAFAGLDLGELGDDLETFGLGKADDSLALGFEAEARAALLLGRDAVIGDQW